MYYKIFIEQMKRSRKTVFYILLMIVATAFFVTSMNLYENSIRNLEISENAFSTLAVTELYGEVDKYGQLVERNSEEHIGYKAVGVKGYDFSDIIDSEAVESWDLRSQYGAYIEGHPAVFYTSDDYAKGDDKNRWYMRGNNIIRFKIPSDEPVSLNYSNDPDKLHEKLFNLNVLDEAAGCFDYPSRLYYKSFVLNQEEWMPYSEEIRKFNRTDDTDKLIFYPDVEYVAVLDRHGFWKWKEETGDLEYVDSSIPDISFSFSKPVQDYDEIRLTYDNAREGLEFEKEFIHFPIQRWDDVQADPQLKAYFEDIWQDTSVQQYTHNVVATNDFTSIPPYHIGGAALTEGRLITPEEYASGAKVCLISDEMAQNQRWKIGDKLNMRLFESEYIPGTTYFVPFQPNLHNQPIYDGEKTPFIHEGEYEIVGIYSVYPTIGNTELAPNTLDLLPYNIYIPTNSVSKIRESEDIMVHGSTFSVKLKNGSVDQFLADMEEKGMTTQKEGRYEPKFTFYDQGYSAVQSSLLSMNSTAKLLLLLSSILLLIVCILVAYFFWQNQKQTVGIFRMLGGTKKQAISAILLCAMVLTVAGAAIGGIVGYGTAYFVGNGIVRDNIAEIEMDMSKENDISVLTAQESDIKINVDPLVTLEACGASLIFPTLLLGFAALDINKEPRELLPKGKL